MIYFCVKFQKDPLFGVNLTFFAPRLPWQRPPFEFAVTLTFCLPGADIADMLIK
jgi:hypothetical protein